MRLGVLGFWVVGRCGKNVFLSFLRFFGVVRHGKNGLFGFFCVGRHGKNVFGMKYIIILKYEVVNFAYI